MYNFFDHDILPLGGLRRLPRVACAECNVVVVWVVGSRLPLHVCRPAAVAAARRMRKRRRDLQSCASSTSHSQTDNHPSRQSTHYSPTRCKLSLWVFGVINCDCWTPIGASWATMVSSLPLPLPPCLHHSLTLPSLNHCDRTCSVFAPR